MRRVVMKLYDLLRESESDEGSQQPTAPQQQDDEDEFTEGSHHDLVLAEFRERCVSTAKHTLQRAGLLLSQRCLT